uniref:Uncharacterized protein n=1 Tax=Panagrolaimus sp. ES5 TaxID=591445 RepID=A0AC34GM34_9BILA
MENESDGTCSRLFNEKESDPLCGSDDAGNGINDELLDIYGNDPKREFAGIINGEFCGVQKGINGERRCAGYEQFVNGEIIDMEPIGDELCESIYECGVKGEHCECEPSYCNADPAGANLYCYEDAPMKAWIYMDKDDLSCDDNHSD